MEVGGIVFKFVPAKEIRQHKLSLTLPYILYDNLNMIVLVNKNRDNVAKLFHLCEIFAVVL